MFLDFYKLREQPFGVTSDPRFLYPARHHREALASLSFAVENGLGFSALIAEPGLGKTTLLLRLLEILHAKALTAFLFETQCNSVGLLRYLANELDLSTEEKDATSLHERLEELLVKVANNGRRIVLIVDEAQNLDPAVLETIRLLSNFETRRAKLIHIVLSGQPHLAERLAKPDMAQLEQRISTTSWLRPLTADEASRYIDHRLRAAGYHGAVPLFDEEAAELIAARSGGIPRKINRLCFNVLSLGCALGEHRITKALVEEAGSDMGLRLLALEQAPPVFASTSAEGRPNDSAGFLQADEENPTGGVPQPSPVASASVNDGLPAAAPVAASNLNAKGSMFRKTLLLIALGISCCVLPLQGQKEPETSPGATSGKPQFATRNPRYQIRPADTLEISFYPTPEFNQTLSVGPDGYITLREAGDVHVASKTVPELREAIVAAYARILNEPVITIVLKDFEKPHFIVGGQVGHPGKFDLRADTTVSEGIAIAGGLTERSKHSQVLLFRRVSEDWSEVKSLNLKAIYKGKWQEDIHLRPNDMLFVPQNRISKLKPFLPNWTVGTYMGPGIF